jgi:hypothetical protein
VQPAGEAVVLLVEFGAGVQPGHDDLDPGDLLLRVHVHGHAAAVVDHLQRAVLEQGDLDAVGKPGNGLVHGIVDHLLGQVVGPGGVGVHPGTPLDGLEAPQDLEVGGVVISRAVSHNAACPKSTY